MKPKTCPQCGAPLDEGAPECEYCGERFAPIFDEAQSQPQSQYEGAQNAQQYPQQYPQPSETSGYPTYEDADKSLPYKNRLIAALLAFFLGTIGIHKFYLGKTFTGILYLVFCWTGIPSLISFFEAIILLCSSDESFERKYKCRTR